MPRLDGRRALFTATAVAFGLFTTACRGPVISVDDAVVVGGAPARLAAVVEYEPAWSLGANCGNDDVASVAFMIDRANDWGYDAIEIGKRTIRNAHDFSWAKQYFWFRFIDIVFDTLQNFIRFFITNRNWA